MNETIEQWLDRDLVGELLSQTINAPQELLGMHMENGVQIFTAFRPYAEHVFVTDDKGGNEKELECLHPDGLFGIAVETDLYKAYKYKVQYAEDDIVSFYDPYNYPVTMTSFDFHLFGEGKHYEIFEKLGAHLETVDSVTGTRFAVYAPNADAVSVVGSFNMWDGSIHPMILHQNNGVYELFIPGVAEGDTYKYLITSRKDKKIFKTDPYGNYAEIRPYNASKVYDINRFKWTDRTYFRKRQRLMKEDRERLPMNIYEVHLGSWRHNEENYPDKFYTYREAADELGEYLSEMGYTHVELIGISEYPYDASWGYQVGCYYAPTSRYGTPSDFMYFVDKMHKLGIEVILDWVPAHFPRDSHALGLFDGQPLYEHPDSRRGEHPDWGTYIFDYGRNEVSNFLIANALFWVDKYHIDGLRADAVASMLYLDYGKQDGQWIPNRHGGHEHEEAISFLQHLNKIMSKRHPEAYIIAEESTAWQGVTTIVKEGGLGFAYKWNMGWMNDFTEYMKMDPYFKSHHYDQLKFSLSYYLAEKYILVLSHDEVVHGKGSLIDKMSGSDEEKFAGLKASYGYMFGHPGKKLLFMGQEFAQRDEWSESKELDWGLLDSEPHSKMKQFVKDLNHLYLEKDAFYYNDYNEIGFEWMDCENPDKNTVTFVRRGKTTKSQLLFAVSFSPLVQEEYTVNVPCAGKYKEILNSDDKIYGGEGRLNDKPITAKKIEEKEIKAEEKEEGTDEVNTGTIEDKPRTDYEITMMLPPLSVVILEFDYVKSK